ncbi:hypothetical protein AALP_AA5G103900 [Arabis alpina]|uniref:Uncharacterized protein n=1 Tax=Arabis alpina TaxID=50452 RepID=A0A087GW67_ARAAL|nr:hypothetical protein AALP_AA5G103900 [Arabis alpina]
MVFFFFNRWLNFALAPSPSSEKSVRRYKDMAANYSLERTLCKPQSYYRGRSPIF